jgi:dTDP-4-dehydrorhamnose reductase
VDRCEVDKELAWRTNVDGTINIVEGCTKWGAYLAYVSTDFVFDGEKGMYVEEDPTRPVNYYGYTKLKAEESVRGLSSRYFVARASVIFGANPATGKMNFVLWLINKLRNGETVDVATDQWNSPTLNTSLAQMLLEAVGREVTGTHHLSGATRADRYSFSRLAADIFELDSDLIRPVLSRQFSWVAKRPKDSSLDTSKAQSAFRSKPMMLETALSKMREEMP